MSTEDCPGGNVQISVTDVQNYFRAYDRPFLLYPVLSVDVVSGCQSKGIKAVDGDITWILVSVRFVE